MNKISQSFVHLIALMACLAGADATAWAGTPSAPELAGPLRVAMDAAREQMNAGHTAEAEDVLQITIKDLTDKAEAVRLAAPDQFPAQVMQGMVRANELRLAIRQSLDWFADHAAALPVKDTQLAYQRQGLELLLTYCGYLQQLFHDDYSYQTRVEGLMQQQAEVTERIWQDPYSWGPEDLPSNLMIEESKKATSETCVAVWPQRVILSAPVTSSIARQELDLTLGQWLDGQEPSISLNSKSPSADLKAQHQRMTHELTEWVKGACR